MNQPQTQKESYKREVLAYHGLPTVSILMLVAVFLAVYFVSGNYLLASVCAAVPFVVIMWRWILAGREVDRRGCPNCLQPFPKKLYWKYPPRVCPRCGRAIFG